MAQRDVTVHVPTAFRPPSRANSQSCAGLPLSNHSSAGFETSPGAAQQSSDQHSERLDLNDAFRSSMQPGPVAHACCRLADALARSLG